MSEAVERFLLENGLSGAEVVAIRARLLEP